MILYADNAIGNNADELRSANKKEITQFISNFETMLDSLV
jgi:hypothetical protein